ncbi:MAG: PLP-dependent aminotransferase family protein, partial [Chloroflexota bacterium]|nr:PLP-dependent aminotransferase family protein [Chloroflexota bacterium]
MAVDTKRDSKHTTSTENAFALGAKVAKRNAAFGNSIWTEILNQFAKHQDPVYFGDGAPARELMPVERLREASARAWDDAPAALGYGDQQGYAPLRELIVERMLPLGIEAEAGQILVTSGSTQGIDLASKVFLEPGDVVIVENPTFLGALETFTTYEARVVPVAMDEHGMRMDALEAALAAEPRAKMIYTIPTFQNPTGSTLPIDRRQRMVELALRSNVVIVEDDPYSELFYDGERTPAIRSLDPNAIYLGTFSKTIAPGIRTGWTVARPEIHRLLLANREVMDISNDRIMMRTVYHTALDFLDDHVGGARDVYRSRRDAMLKALSAYMPEGVTWSRPRGGFFIWITLPDHLNTHDLANEAAADGVIFFPGHWFYPLQDQFNGIRLSYSTVPEDRIDEGVRRLAATLHR